MKFAPFDPLTASNDDLVTWCETANFIHGGECCEGLVRPASHVVIKIGSGVTEEEARNQRFAYEQLKDTDFQVPQVYRYFSKERDSVPKGYLMMEYIPGRTMEECMKGREKDEVYYTYARRIFEAACTISRIVVPPFQPPGPVGGGESRGRLFNHIDVDCGATFTSIETMNSWLNQRLQLAQDPSSKVRRCIDIHDQARHGTLDFHDADLVMIHGDLAPRNFIVTDNGKLAIVDWAFAGFYPKVFERFNCLIRASWDPVLSEVSELLRDSKELDSTIWKLQCVQTANFICPPWDSDSSLHQPTIEDLVLIEDGPYETRAPRKRRVKAKNPMLVNRMEMSHENADGGV